MPTRKEWGKMFKKREKREREKKKNKNKIKRIISGLFTLEWKSAEVYKI